MAKQSGKNRAYNRGYEDGRSGKGDQATYTDGLVEVLTVGALREPDQEQKREIYKKGLAEGRKDRKEHGKR